ncbi:MAG TPA: M17 family peptidase N-terminal domain-containing protein [Bacillota bacterium]|nr:M17 family peptidase N-terminal domain-containing protein [Bacillota bacterium]
MVEVVAGRGEGAQARIVAVAEGEAVLGLPPEAARAPRETGLGRVSTVYLPEPGPRCLVLVGVGRRDALDRRAARIAAAAGVRAARSAGAASASLAAGGFGPADAAVEGALAGLYRFERYKGEAAPGALTRLHVEGATEAEVRRGHVLGSAVSLARDLANTPGADLPPAALAEAAAGMARAAGLECAVLEPDALARAGLGLLLGVGQGSRNGPRLIALRYRCGRPDAPLLALVGKGITFDSGGLSLKTGEGMIAMKMDKSGACAVIGAMQAIAALRPAGCDILGIVAAAENMPGGGAFRPGDVLKGLAGKTIEIISTDAEGRLVLGDGVAYACAQGAKRIVDVATLTGAVSVALGKEAAGLLGNDGAWVGEVRAAAGAAGERVWELPTFPEYRQLYKSDVADIKNSGGRGAGTITGGMIIGEFVAAGHAWAHLDIAGVAWVDRDTPACAFGATGFGVTTLVSLAERAG